MARIRLSETADAEIALVINDKVQATWGCPHKEATLKEEIPLIQQMLHEAYERGRDAKKEEISKTLRGIFGLKE